MLLAPEPSSCTHRRRPRRPRARRPRPRRAPRRRRAPGPGPAPAAARRRPGRRGARPGRRTRPSTPTTTTGPPHSRVAPSRSAAATSASTRRGVLRARRADRPPSPDRAGRRRGAAARRPRPRRRARAPAPAARSPARPRPAAGRPGERGPQRACHRAVERRALEQQHRALGGGRVERDDVLEAAGPAGREQPVGQPGACEGVLHPRGRERPRGLEPDRVPGEQRSGRLQQRPGPALPSRTTIPTVPSGACTSVERRPARSAGTFPSRRSASAFGPSSASPWSPPTLGSSSASVASVRGCPLSCASSPASPSRSSSTATRRPAQVARPVRRRHQRPQRLRIGSHRGHARAPAPRRRRGRGAGAGRRARAGPGRGRAARSRRPGRRPPSSRG